MYNSVLNLWTLHYISQGEMNFLVVYISFWGCCVWAIWAMEGVTKNPNTRKTKKYRIELKLFYLQDSCSFRIHESKEMCSDVYVLFISKMVGFKQTQNKYGRISFLKHITSQSNQIIQWSVVPYSYNKKQRSKRRSLKDAFELRTGDRMWNQIFWEKRKTRSVEISICDDMRVMWPQNTSIVSFFGQVDLFIVFLENVLSCQTCIFT